MGSPSKSIVLSLAALLCLSLIIGCDEDPVVVDDPPCDNCTPLAYELLEDLLFEYQGLYEDFDDADRPGDFDFTPAQDMYQAAFDADNSDTAARFGLAACTLLSLTADSEVNAAFDHWKAYLEDHTPFEIDDSAKSMGLPLGMPASSAALELPFELVTCSAMAPLKAQFTGDAPLLSDVQDILLTVVLPATDTCIELMTPLADVDDFTFIMSPMMQGSIYEDPLELDQVEVMVMLAACKLLKAGIGVAAAYDVQFDSYDADGMYDGLKPGGNVGQLLPGGEARMQAVPDLFLEAVNIVDEALDVLQAEPSTDPDQDDDIIKIGPRDVDQQDIDNMQAIDLPDVRRAFSAAGTNRTENWDGRWDTPETSLKINLLNFFATPEADFKELLPPYTLVIVTADEHDYEYGNATRLVDVPAQTSYSEYSVSYEDGVAGTPYSSGAYPDFITACEDIVDAKIAELEADPSWTGDASFWFEDWNSHSAGSHTIDIWYNFSWSWGYSAPEIHWVAQTFAEWTAAMPDPTISGLLPDMADGAELCATFGVEEHDWDPVMTYEWIDGDFGGGPVIPEPDEPVTP